LRARARRSASRASGGAGSGSSSPTASSASARTQPPGADFTTADAVTLPRHLRIGEPHEGLTTAPLADLARPAGPAAVDADGRPAQTFLVEAVVRAGERERRGWVAGRDIYAVTAPLVVEATRRILGGLAPRAGVVSAGELGDARGFLEALAPHGV